MRFEPRPSRDPQRPADLLGGILRQLRGCSNRTELNRLLRKSLGVELAPHCQVLGLRGGILHVEVDSAPLYAELQSFRAEQLRSAMNAALRVSRIARIKFRMGGTGHV